MVLLINKFFGATGKTRISRPLMWAGQLVSFLFYEERSNVGVNVNKQKRSSR